ncbi:MAG: C25 family cysteine peptidase [Candidatus Eisenbacteria bacterium]
MGLRLPLVRLASLAACLCLLTSVSAAKAGSLQLHWAEDDVRVVSGGDGYVGVELAGGGTSALPGSPDLPWVAVSVPLEPGQTIGDWAFEGRGWVAIGVGVTPRPVIDQEEIIREGRAKPTEDPTLYTGTEDFPGEPVRYLGVQAARGVVSGAFLVCPFRWNPVTQVLEFATSGQLSYTAVPGGPAGTLPVPYRPAALPLDRSLPEASTTFGRAATGGTAVHSLSALGESEVPSLEGTPVEFLLVTTDEFAPVFEELIAWKNETGVPAAIRTVSWIEDHYPYGVDRPEQMRYFLRDAYLYWGTRTVLLCGDPTKVPARYAQDYSWNGLNGGTAIVTDHYYACLDGNWNANGNDLFGEPPIPSYGINSDFTDLRPELRVGRVSCSSLTEAQTYMKKYREYAINPPQDDYLARGVVAAEVLFEREWVIGDCEECATCDPEDNCPSEDGAEHAIGFIESLYEHEAAQDMTFEEYYERDYHWVGLGRPNAQALNLENLVGAMNRGANVVFHSGHGDRDRWAIGPDRLEAVVVRGLTNGSNGKRWTGMVYSINCNSAAIDYDCLAESFHFAPNGGGLIYVGSTNLDFPTSAEKMQNLTFSQWPGDGFSTPGDGFFYAADSVGKSVNEIRSPDRFVLYSLAFLGDPDMFVWHSVPKPMTVSFPSQLSVGGGVTTVSVEQDGTPLANARVALYKDGDALATGFTAVDGFLEIDFNPSGVGEYAVTVTHPEGIPFHGTGQVVAGGNAFAAMASVVIDDVENEATGVRGNGNGVFDVGETVAIDLGYENRGSGAIANLEATLALAAGGTTPGIEVEILTGSASLGSLAQGGTGTKEGAFLVRASSLPSATERMSTVPLELTWDQDGATHVEPAPVAVYRAELVMYGLGVTEQVGDGDGEPDAGEQFLLDFEFLNQGLGTPYGYELRLIETQHRATIDPLNVPIEAAGPLQHAHTTSQIYIGYNFPPNLVNLHYEIWDVSDPENERLVSSTEFDQYVPTAPTGLRSKGYQDRIVLGWDPAESEDAYAYRVYRSENAEGPFEAAGVGLVPLTSASPDDSYYSDDGLPPLTGYFYKVTVLDASGNESQPSELVEATTTPAPLTGWPVTLSDHNASAPLVEQLDGGGYEVIAATDVVYAFNQGGGDYYDGDQSESTRGVLTEPEDGYKFDGRPAIFDIDGDGHKEIIAASRYRGRLDTDRVIELTCFDYHGNIKWSQYIGATFALCPPAIGDIDGDGDYEVCVLSNRSVWAFHHDGTPVEQAGAIRALPDSEGSYMYGGIAIADVYDGGDAAEEIIFTSRVLNSNTGGSLYILNGTGDDIPGFPIRFVDEGYQLTNSNSSPAVVDLLPEPTVGTPPLGEVIVTTWRNIFAVDPQGSDDPIIWSRSLAQWDYLESEVNPSPAIGDIDPGENGGVPEVVITAGPVGGKSTLYVLNAVTGEPKPAFMTGSDPYLLVDAERLGSPIIGDVTGDDYPEIIFGSKNGNVYGYDHNGQVVRGFPFANGGQVYSGLVLWDIDKNGTVELVVQASQVLNLTVIEFAGTQFDVVNPNLTRYPWTQFRHDTRNTGNTMVHPITPLALQAPNLEQTGVRTVRLRWLAEEGFSEFQLERRLAGAEDWEAVGSWPANDLRDPDGFYQLEDTVPEFGTYAYRLVGVEPGGAPVVTPEQTISVSAAGLQFALGAARPNPSNGTTQLELTLPRASRGRVVVVDPSGRIVRTLIDGTLDAGVAEVEWDGLDDAGRGLGAGVYFVRAEINAFGKRSSKVIRVR